MLMRTCLCGLVLVAAGCGDDVDIGAAETTGMLTDGVSAETTATTGPTGTATVGGTAETGVTTGEPPPSMVRLDRVVDGLTAPTGFASATDGTLVVLDQTGIAYRIENGELQMFADLQDRIVELQTAYDERGLLGLAFHPAFPSDPRVFVYYSAPLRAGAPEGYDHTNVLSEFSVGEAGQLDPDTERELLALDWPFSNHNGGRVAFGPDENLFFSMGDGGRANDTGLGHPPLGNGQDWTTLMGSILRIDPDGGDPYGIPPDNPFVGAHEGADEIWAYGLRNPYAFAFDPRTGDLFVGDAGQNLMEEIDLAEAGDNLGWNIKEGTLCFDPQDADTPSAQCPDVGPNGEPLVDPILTYTHADSVVEEMSDIHGEVVVGGRVYRGLQVGGLEGAYVFGTWSQSMQAPQGQLLVGRRTGEDWSLERLPVEGTPTEHIGYYVRGFGQDLDGEIYVLTSELVGPSGNTGAVWRIARAP